MGGVFSSLWSYWFPNEEYRLVMVGLDNAGKTTTLYKLLLGETVVSQPTVGGNVERIPYKNLVFEIWDLGGQANLRPSWAAYFKNTDAVVMVVDSTDRARIGTTKAELFTLLENKDVEGAPVLVFANKQDLREAMDSAELSQALTLHKIRNHDWHIQASCATTGEGLVDGLTWIAEKLKARRNPG
ncbi:hypothetical protein BSKO_01011 [Bryopsis sp. KO-2023]|nr:hypothetical protein BSKO_01011 [Bryopsis sp. KO-2023]